MSSFDVVSRRGELSVRRDIACFVVNARTTRKAAEFNHDMAWTKPHPPLDKTACVTIVAKNDASDELFEANRIANHFTI